MLIARALGEEYVDAFFADGSLRLSSFEKFREHPDELRRDEIEGCVALNLVSPDGNTFQSLGVNADEAYILCASHIADKTVLAKRGQCGIAILDLHRFAKAVGEQIPGYAHCERRPCIYREDTLVTKPIDRVIAPPDDGEDPQAWFAEQQRFLGAQAMDGYFLKRAKYEDEAEYRFIWFAAGTRKSYIHLKCPAARDFCERV